MVAVGTILVDLFHGGKLFAERYLNLDVAVSVVLFRTFCVR